MTKVPELVCLIGIQGSGKSTFAARYFPQHVLVSKDLMSRRNKASKQALMIHDAMQDGRNIVVDNTNVWLDHRQLLADQARDGGYRYVGYYFDTNLGECLERNAQREGIKKVPEYVIEHFHQTMNKPDRAEFDEAYIVRPIGAGLFEIEPWR